MQIYIIFVSDFFYGISTIIGDQTTWLLELHKSHFLIQQSICDLENIHNGSP